MYNRIESFWQDDYFFPFYDVVIVGGGFTGLIAGIELLLRKPKYKVGVFESETYGTLASSRNAGFMCYGSPTELLADIETYGEDAVVSLLAQKKEGYDTLLKHLAGNKHIYRKVHGFELFDKKHEDQALLQASEKLEYLNTCLQKGTGITNYFATPVTFRANNAFDAIQFKQEGQLQPTAAVAALTKKFVNLGGLFHAANRITAWSALANGYAVQSSVGKEVRTRKMIIANNAFATGLLPDYPVQPNRAQVLVTAPLQTMPFIGNFHMQKGYVYFRNIGNRLLLGGLRHLDFTAEATSQIELNPHIQQALDQLLAELIPSNPIEITHRWSGIMGFHNQKSPALHIHPSGIIVAAGMNGMGTLLGPSLGKKAALFALKP